MSRGEGVMIIANNHTWETFSFFLILIKKSINLIFVNFRCPWKIWVNATLQSIRHSSSDLLMLFADWAKSTCISETWDFFILAQTNASVSTDIWESLHFVVICVLVLKFLYILHILLDIVESVHVMESEVHCPCRPPLCELTEVKMQTITVFHIFLINNAS